MRPAWSSSLRTDSSPATRQSGAAMRLGLLRTCGLTWALGTSALAGRSVCLLSHLVHIHHSWNSMQAWSPVALSLHESAGVVRSCLYMKAVGEGLCISRDDTAAYTNTIIPMSWLM